MNFYACLLFFYVVIELSLLILHLAYFKVSEQLFWNLCVLCAFVRNKFCLVQRHKRHEEESTISSRLWYSGTLFLSFVMNGMFAQPWAVFAQFEFFSTRLSSDGVVIITCLFADEKDGLRFLFTFFSFTFACHA